VSLLEHVLGLDDPSGRWYLWWSGPFADVALFSAPIVLLRKHNCHVKGCPRLGRHGVPGTGFVVCRRHHPDDRPTAADVRRAAP
jgi:hypothetical protein